MIQCIHDDDSDWFSRHVPIIHIFVVSIKYGDNVAPSNLYLNVGAIGRNVSMILSMLNKKFVQGFVSKRFTCYIHLILFSNYNIANLEYAVY